MIIASLRLKNIRSYRDAEITLPEGSLLLAGDVGAGKSSILLAVEFALFGILRGSLEGEALLRHGSERGSVDLLLGLGGKKIRVCRSLRRGRNGVAQDKGFLEIDNERLELTPAEIKARIFDLLGYPPQTAAKSRDLIYRYTVYTPQEEMKRILAESSGVRLEMLRRVFQVESYKRIMDNAQVALRKCREQIRDAKIRAEGIGAQKEKILQSITAIEFLGKDAAELKKKREDLLLVLELQQKTVEELGGRAAEYRAAQKLKSELLSRKQELERRKGMSLRKVAEDSQYIERLTQKISAEPALLEQIGRQKGNAEDATDFEREGLELRRLRDQALLDKARLMSSSSDIMNITAKVDSLSVCPLCLQEIASAHKKKLQEEHREKLTSIHDELGALDARIQDFDATQQKIEDRQKAFHEGKSMLAEAHEKLKRIGDYKDERERAKKSVAELIAEMGSYGAVLSEIEQKLSVAKAAEGELALLEERERQVRKEAELKRLQEQDLLMSISRREQEAATLSKILEKDKKELAEMERHEQAAKKLSETENWLLSSFVPVMSQIEGEVMLLAHHQFSAYFRSWFQTLIDEESIMAGLDADFTPQITQAGYIVPVEHLSGGEKTSCALAYRLALAKVINELMTPLKTQDIIILDEPTDGFSNEQLDRMRDILSELSFRQTIIVSHEPKMEGFVDHVIRVRKADSRSEIIAQA